MQWCNIKHRQNQFKIRDYKYLSISKWESIKRESRQFPIACPLGFDVIVSIHCFVKEQITGLSRSVIRHTLHFDN